MSKSSSSRLLIAVTSNADDSSEGTLRWAIQQTQNTEGDDQKFDIVFSEMPVEGNTTGLKTGAWTIPLKTVLPNIYKNDIRINYLKPKNITIHPAEFKVDNDTPKGLSPWPMMTLNHGLKQVGQRYRPETGRETKKPHNGHSEGFNGTSPSMLVVGDGHLVHQHLNKGMVNLSPRDPDTRSNGIPLPFKVSGTRPTLAVNQINFVGNETRGGNGTRQAGGGGAMGGAILLIDGDLTIENSVFQNLRVTGGKTTGFNPRGGENAKNSDSILSRGEDGGQSGYFSTPIYRFEDLNGTDWGWTEYEMQGLGYPRDFPHLYGGDPGCVGESGEYKCENKEMNGREGKHAWRPLWGYGWRSGSAGGPGGYEENYCFMCENEKIFFYGGRGGDGGGYRSTAAKEKILVGGSGMGAPGNKGGDNTNRTDGEEGFGLGGAIAIIGDHPQLKEHANPVLKLNNVDFNNVMASHTEKANWSGTAYFPVGYANEYIFTYDIDKSNIYANNSFSKPFDGGSVEAVDMFREYSPDQTSSSLPFKEGRSSPMNDKVAAVRANVIETRINFDDVILVEVEDLKTTIPVTADLSNPENPINQIWNSMLDFDEEATKSEYYASKAPSSGPFTMDNLFEGAMVLGGLALNAGCTLGLEQLKVFKSPIPKLGGDTIHTFDEKGNKTVTEQKGSAAASICGAVISAADAAIRSEYYGARENEAREAAFTKSMERHHKKREHLNNALEKHSNAKIGEVDIRLQRSPVVVEDFEIGRDVVFFPHGENMGNIIAEESINTGIPGRNRVKEVHLSYSANDNTSLPFLTLRLPQGQKNIKGGIADYVSKLITAITPKAFGAKVNMISNSTQEQDVAEEREYIAQGPADHTVVVSRRKRAALKKLEEPIEVNTNEGNDYIVGSYGVERIDSGDGNDVLLPVAGNDVVDGNDGQDVVSYVSLYHPIAFEADTSGSVFASGTYFLYSFGDEDGSTEVEEGSFDRAELKNIEGYQAFGASTFNLSGLNEPESLALKAKGANGAEEEEHLLKYLYSVKTGSGSSVVGSNYDDAIEVSYYQSFNEPQLSETAEFTISDEAFSRSSDIKAGVGNDLLLLDLSAAPLNQIKMAPSGDGFSILASIQGQEMSQIISASGVDVLNISLPDKSDDFDDSSFECVEGVKCIVDLGQVNKAQGSDSGNLLRGEVGQDVLKGLRGGDKLYGGRDSDRLFGGKGKDLLIGGPGSDFLNGGRGSDVMRGGVGPDTYRLSKGRDVVRGFEVGTDIIQASGIPELSQQGKNVLLSYAVGTTLLRKTALDDVAEWLIPQAGGLELLA